MHIRVLTKHLKCLRTQVEPVASVQMILCQKRSYCKHAYFHQMGGEPLVYRNLGQQILRAAKLYGKRPAVISCHENKRLNFDDITREAECLAFRLKELGLHKGDHVGIWATNTLQWYITYLATGLAGYPLVCINPALQSAEVEYALKKAKVRALITMDECGKQDFYGVLKEVIPDVKSKADIINDPKLPDLRCVLMKTEKEISEFINYDAVVNCPPNTFDIAYLQQKVHEIPPEWPCNIQFTSGTTGKPKAALITHFSYINQGHYFGPYMKMDESHKHVCFTVPFFHAFGMSVIMAALDYGATLVLPSPRFNAVAALDAIEKEGCNIVLGTPTMYVDMLEQQQRLKKHVHSLELGLVGGAACSPEVFMQTKTMLGLKEMIIAYGQSESSAAVFTHDGTEPMDTAVGTVGRLYEHAEAKVVNDKGETVYFGERGELCVRGYFIMRGYFDDEERTKEVFTEDRWLRTGDEFILEESGIGQIIGRKNDLIIRGGENLYPKEIEDFLDTHEDILEAQVIGVPDARMGEEICAYLRLKPGSKKLSADDIREFCTHKIAHFKIPRYVRIVEDFPKTNSGKIQKYKLREMFQGH